MTSSTSVKLIGILWGFFHLVPSFASDLKTAHTLCIAEQESDHFSLIFQPADTPYAPQIYNIKDFFLVKGIYFTSLNDHPGYTKISTYYLTELNEPVLIHQMRFDENGKPDGDATLGKHLIYSPLYGRELRLQCKVIKNANKI